MPYDPTTFEVHIYDDWAALYIDGELHVEGHEYNVNERIFNLLGIKEVQDDAFMRGRTGHDTAPTLDDVRRYKEAREDTLARVEELRREADNLRLRAEELELEAKGVVED